MIFSKTSFLCHVQSFVEDGRCTTPCDLLILLMLIKHDAVLAVLYMSNLFALSIYLCIVELLENLVVCLIADKV